MSELIADRPDSENVPALCRELMRIDSSNYGDGRGPGERACAEYVMTKLCDAGYEPELLESADKRANVMLRIPGSEPQEGNGLVLHGHLDVVPAQADEWTLPPFAGEEHDGLLWGRGAVDMKGMDAMILGLVLDMKRAGVQPKNDMTVAFFADEEAGGVYGAHWMVENHPQWFEGCGSAISEVGGFSITLDGKRCYLLQTAEKGMLWLRLVAQGRAGHGSQVGTDNAVTHLCEAVTRIGSHKWPLEITPTVRAFLEAVTEITGTPLDYSDFGALTARLGTTARWVGATLQNTANPTMLDAGYKHNVIPAQATGLVDCRYLPGRRDDLMRTIKQLAGDRVEVEVVHEDKALATDLTGDLPSAMVRSLMSEDPEATVAPYCLAGATDNKALDTLGIRGFGFAPLRLPPDLDFAGMFHGVDERVPAESLVFGRRVLERLVLGEKW